MDFLPMHRWNVAVLMCIISCTLFMSIHGAGKNFDYYAVLGVDRKATLEDIKQARRAKILEWHPDKQHQENKAQAEEMTKRINEAYAVLSDSEQRGLYDRSFATETAPEAKSESDVVQDLLGLYEKKDYRGCLKLCNEIMSDSSFESLSKKTRKRIKIIKKASQRKLAEPAKEQKMKKADLSLEVELALFRLYDLATKYNDEELLKRLEEDLEVFEQNNFFTQNVVNEIKTHFRSLKEMSLQQQKMSETKFFKDSPSYQKFKELYAQKSASDETYVKLKELPLKQYEELCNRCAMPFKKKPSAAAPYERQQGVAQQPSKPDFYGIEVGTNFIFTNINIDAHEAYFKRLARGLEKDPQFSLASLSHIDLPDPERLSPGQYGAFCRTLPPQFTVGIFQKISPAKKNILGIDRPLKKMQIEESGNASLKVLADKLKPFFFAD